MFVLLWRTFTAPRKNWKRCFCHVPNLLNFEPEPRLRRTVYNAEAALFETMDGGELISLVGCMMMCKMDN